MTSGRSQENSFIIITLYPESNCTCRESFLTQCYVWVVSVTDQWKPGKTWSNGMLETCYLKDLNRIDGEPMEFEWTIFPGFTTLKILDEIQKMMTELQCEPEHFKGRIICMSMYNDNVWREGGNKENCMMNSVTNADHARRFSPGRWSFLGPGSEKKWYGTHPNKLDGVSDRTAEGMMLNFAESGSHISCHKCPEKRRIEKQRERSEIDSLQQS